jgi:putative NADH-flavin reductase
LSQDLSFGSAAIINILTNNHHLMNITLLGATGKLGQEILKQALDQGHNIKALVRNPTKLAIQHERLEIVQADVLHDSSDRIAMLLAGSDAVISAIGTGYSVKITTIYSRGTQKIVEAMEQANIRRLVVVSSCGTDPEPTEPWWYLWLVRRLLINVYIDMTRMEENIMRRDNLEWTIVRPSQLTNGAPKEYRVNLKHCPEGGYKISRADVASFMIQQVRENTYLRQIPALCY